MTSPAPRRVGSIVTEPRLHLPPRAREAMVQHALNCLPDEACGLVAVDGARQIRMVYPLTNSEHSPTSFTIDPREHFGALRHADRSGWSLGGVFHSHPLGTAELSSTDLDQPHDPDWFHIVVGFSPRLEVRGWEIRGATAIALPLPDPEAAAVLGSG